MNHNRFENLDRALGVNSTAVKPPKIDRSPLPSEEERQLALFHLKQWIDHSSITRVAGSKSRETTFNIEELSEMFRRVASDYVESLFNYPPFKPYQGHFLTTGNNPSALKRLYWGKCLSNAGGVGILLRQHSLMIQSGFTMPIMENDIRQIRIAGLIPRLEHYVASIRLISGEILFWDFTVPQYWDLSPLIPKTPVLWGIFSDNGEMLNSISSFFNDFGISVQLQPG